MSAFRRRPDVLLTELPDRTGVVLHLAKRSYYPLTSSGVLLWHRFDGGAVVDDDELVAALIQRYGIDAERALDDVHAFVDRLVAEAILEQVPT